MMAWQRQQQSEVHARPSRCRHQEPDEFDGFASEKGEEGLTPPPPPPTPPPPAPRPTPPTIVAAHALAGEQLGGVGTF